MQGTGVDEDVDEGILVGDGLLIAEFRAFDAELDGLGVDALQQKNEIYHAFLLVCPPSTNELGMTI